MNLRVILVPNHFIFTAMHAHCLVVLPNTWVKLIMKCLKLGAKISLSSCRHHHRYFCCHGEQRNKYNFSRCELIQLLWDPFLCFFVRRCWLLMKIQLKCYLFQPYASPKSKLIVCLIKYLPLSSHTLFW